VLASAARPIMVTSRPRDEPCRPAGHWRTLRWGVPSLGCANEKGGVAVNAEGWYVDPFGSHQARWFSDGTPTSLVRDNGHVGHDEPPSVPYEGTPTPLPDIEEDDADDLRRADNEEEPYDQGKGVRAVLDMFDQLPPM
jgi:hypothetical protein